MIPENLKTLETDRLIIRETTEEDCKVFAEWERDPAVTEFFTISADRSYGEILSEVVSEKSDPSCLYYTITYKPDGEPCGRIMISRLDRHYDSMDLTRIYIGDPALRDKGLGREALEKILGIAFTELGMERVTIDHFPANKRADHLYRKLGFVDEGIMRNSGKKDGRYVDLQLKSILREEYEKKYLSSSEVL